MLNPSELSEVPYVPPAPGADSPALVIGRLYEHHERMIRALCRLLMRHEAEAEDAAQQTFLSAYGSLINGTVPERPAAWLATIARRECWSRLRQRRDQPLLLDYEDLPQGEARDALEDAIRSADYTALWAAVNALPRQQRAAFLLREFSGLSYGEIADALGATESAIDSLLVRARRQLRDALEPTLRAANLALTPLLLFRHRLLRLLGGKLTAGGAAAGSAPLVTQVGAAVATVVVVSGSVGVGVHAFHGRHAARSVPAARQVLAAQSGGIVLMGVPRPPEEQLLAMLAAPGGAIVALDPMTALLGDTNPATPAADVAATAAGGPAPGSATEPAPASAADGSAPAAPAADGHTADGHPAEPNAATAPGTTGAADTVPAATTTSPADAAPADTTTTADVASEPLPPDTTPVIDPLPADSTTP
jgi:RNA polymerase sigma-70 factor (ECF subfamily)